MNNVDLAIAKVRELQQLIYSPKASPEVLFKTTEKIIEQMDLASKEINTNYAEISEKLTKLMNTGKPQE